MSRVFEKDREPFPPRWMFLVLALMIIAGLVWNVYVTLSATAEKHTAQANSQTLAKDIQNICEQQGKLLVDDRDLCAKATSVQETPSEAISGPKGDKGNDGAPGPRGFTGPKGDQGPLGPVGPKGNKGDRGDDGLAGLTVPGAPGTDGTMGPAGPAGPAGEPGTDGAPGAPGEPGADGAPGKDGSDGRGLADAQCGTDGRWAMSWTDGTTTDGGVCRVDPAPQGPPAPAAPPIGIP